MKIIERNLQEIGKSLLVTLPKEWTDSLKLKKGNKIKIMISEQGLLTIAPEFMIKKEKREALIDYDENIKRHFFGNYLQDNEKITIRFAKPISENERKELYRFLDQFINVQIIEESQDKTIIKCFKIDELSIEDCLKRMYLLSLNMMDELLTSNDRIKILEIENNITKFYYMLVMQIRRYLSEGKFAEKNQIPLIRGMDYRMVAEKIERLADIIKNLDAINDEKLKETLKEIKQYYSKSVNAFVSENYDNAVSLFGEAKKKKINLKVFKEKALRKKDINEYIIINNLEKILDYAKEISMLVR